MSQPPPPPPWGSDQTPADDPGTDRPGPPAGGPPPSEQPDQVPPTSGAPSSGAPTSVPPVYPPADPPPASGPPAYPPPMSGSPAAPLGYPPPGYPQPASGPPGYPPPAYPPPGSPAAPPPWEQQTWQQQASQQQTWQPQPAGYPPAGPPPDAFGGPPPPPDPTLHGMPSGVAPVPAPGYAQPWDTTTGGQPPLGGYPPSPTQQWGPPPPRKGRGGVIAAVIIIVVLLLAGGGVGIALLAGDDKKDNNSGGNGDRNTGAKVKQLWTKSPQELGEPSAADGREARIQGYRSLGETIVVIRDSGAFAFDFATGDKRWEWKAPARVCTFTATQERLYVLSMPSTGGRCTNLVALDNAGKELWKAALPTRYTWSPLGTSLFASPDIVVASGLDAVAGLDATSGDEKWIKVPSTGCRTASAGMGEIGFVSTLRCAGSTETMFVFDPNSGTVKRLPAALPRDSEILAVTKQSIAVAVGGAEKSDKGELAFYDANGGQLARGPATDVASCVFIALDVTQLDRCRLVSEDLLILHRDNKSPVAYDLTTGEQKWTGAGEDAFPSSVGAVAGDTLIAPSANGDLVKYDRNTGQGGGKVTCEGCEDQPDLFETMVERDLVALGGERVGLRVLGPS